MQNRSLADHTRSPNQTGPEVVPADRAATMASATGPVQIAGRLGAASPQPSTRCWCACRINRLSHIDRVTGEPLHRYEHQHPASLIHVDVTKFGNIPDGGGHRFVGTPARRITKRERHAHALNLPRGTEVPAGGTAYGPHWKHRLGGAA